jgi:hypothetical protein
MLLSQVKYKGGTGVVAREAGKAGRIVKGVTSVYDLALAAAETGVGLAEKRSISSVPMRRARCFRRSITAMPPICI